MTNLYLSILSLQLHIIPILSFVTTILVDVVIYKVVHSFIYGCDLDHKCETSWFKGMDIFEWIVESFSTY